MAEEGLLYGNRVWFSDARSPARRMAVTSHPEAGVVVVSLWTGETCTTTFQLPMVDSARLISALADGLALGLPEPTAEVTAPVATPARGWRALLDRAARITRRRPLADVTPITRTRPHQ